MWKSVRNGNGIALNTVAIAKNIVDGLGGTIAVASAAGRGTEIRIDLPIHDAAGSRPNAASAPDTSRAADRGPAPSFAIPR